MNITNDELKALKRLLTREDLSYIADKTKMSASAVNAVFYTRPNNSIETEIVKSSKLKIANYLELLQKIETKNSNNQSVSVEAYNRLKSLATWRTGHDYYLMIDCYLQMAHLKFENIHDLIVAIKLEFKELIDYKYRIVEIAVRLMAVDAKLVIKELQNHL